MTDGEIVTALITRLYNEDDVSAADELLSAELGPRYAAHAGRLRASSTDMRTAVLRVVDDGAGNVAVFYRRTGTHTGPMRGPYVDAVTESGVAEATGRTIDATAAWFARVEGGRIIAVDSVADNLTLFQQVGLVPGTPFTR